MDSPAPKPVAPKHPTRSMRSNLLLLSGSFFSFAPIGFLMVMVTDPPGNWIAGLVNAVISGVIAVLWAASFVFRKWVLLGCTVVGQFFIPALLNRALYKMGVPMALAPDVPRTANQALLALLALACIVAGYVFIISFVRRQEATSTRWKTELDVARRIHETIVPDIRLSTPQIEVFGRSEPSSEMGGDLIDIVSAEGRTDLYLADVSGHGVGAGVVMSMVKSAIRMRVRTVATLDSLLADLNAVLEQLTQSDMFATFACLRFQRGEDGEGAVRVEYALAGHHPILHYSATTKELRQLPNEAVPLGIMPDESFVSSSTTAGRGDLFVIFTDGLTEVMNAEGRMMGSKPIMEIVRLNAERPLDEIHRMVIERARAHGPQVDDQTLLIARVG
ncbi:MAG TPA: PP2C family protein-serine/threonine phosphatase [Phycisphaerales bacterium]|nr:PP2C family protein-serine/threonine phosphatase [Phycisphaerales bacterium]